MKTTKLTPLEWLYLVVGIGIIVLGVIEHDLTPTELGAGMFFIGLLPVTRVDKAHAEDVEQNSSRLLDKLGLEKKK